MKKNLISLFALFAVLFTFSACGNNEPNPDPDPDPDPTPTDSYVCTSAFGMFLGEDIMLGSYSYQILMLEDGVALGEQSFEGTGHVAQVVAISEKNDNFIPNNGKYNANLDPENQEIEIGQCIVAIAKIEDGQQTEDVVYESATFEVVNNGADVKYVVTATINETTTYKFTYEGGQLEFQDQCMTFFMESKEKVNETLESKNCQIQYYQDQAADIYYIDMQSDVYDAITLALVAESGTGTDVSKLAGTYKVSPAGAVGTVAMGFAQASQQGVAIYPSFIGKTDAEGYIETIYYVYDGTVTVAADKIEADLITAYGSTFKITYNGKIEIEAGQGAPSYAPAKQTPSAYVPALQRAIITK